MSASISLPDGVVENDRHHPHDHHTVEKDAAFAPTPDDDPITVIEAALVRLVDDVGVLAEEEVVRAFSILKATDLPSYLRMRHAAKLANRDCSVTVLDRLVRAELPASEDGASALDELVALARAQCQLHHDADRNAVAVLPMPSRREVWRVHSSGFEDWLRAAYWRAKEMGVAETTMKSALATLAAAGINDGDEIDVHVRAARCADGYVIDLGDEQWQAIHVTPQGWRLVNESLVYFTQQINSATSMGRLMLNVLLSFAQFEREVTGERIRDKIAASKAKGMWMGGPVPLGYAVRDRMLVVNEVEAKLVRRIFDDFVTMHSATLMVKAYGAEGLLTKSGKPFTKQTIYKMLHNRMYLGEIVHKGQNFPGQHSAIVTPEQWQAAHALIASDAAERRRETIERIREPVLLRGLLFTPDGERLVPSYTVKKGKTYRYYTPVKHRRFGAWASSHGPLPAAPIEQLVIQQLVAALSAPHLVQSVWDRMQQIRPDLTEPQVVLPMRNLAGLWRELFPAEQCRLAKLLIERVVIADGGLEIVWRDQGRQELAHELMPGTIGAELQELEETI